MQVVDAVSLTLTRVVRAGRMPFAIEAAGGTARQVFIGDRLDGSVARLA